MKFFKENYLLLIIIGLVLAYYAYKRSRNALIPLVSGDGKTGKVVSKDETLKEEKKEDPVVIVQESPGPIHIIHKEKKETTDIGPNTGLGISIDAREIKERTENLASSNQNTLKKFAIIDTSPFNVFGSR